MANTKTKIENEVKEEVKIEDKVEKVVAVKEQYKPVDRNEYIEVICNTYTDLVVADKSGSGLKWMFEGDFESGISAYGTKDEIQYADLLKLRNTKFLNEPWLLIGKEHQNAIKELGLKLLYEKIIYPEDMDEFLDKSVNEIKEFLDKTTTHMKILMASVLIKKSQNGEMDNMSMNKIKMLEHELHIKLG